MISEVDPTRTKSDHKHSVYATLVTVTVSVTDSITRVDSDRFDQLSWFSDNQLLNKSRVGYYNVVNMSLIIFEIAVYLTNCLRVRVIGKYPQTTLSRQ